MSETKIDAFEDYVALQANAAALMRIACEGRQALLDRIEELESSLMVWKVGHREAIKNQEIAERVVRDLDDDPIALALLDGDGCIFHRDFVSKGREGGRECAALLLKCINSTADKVVGRNVSTVCHIFYNKQGLSRVLQDLGIATEVVFSAFVAGLNAAHPLFVMTDVGPQKEAADAKFRSTLQMYAKLPQCKLILAGCEHDGGYSHLLQSLETEGLGKKIRILKSFDEAAFDIKRLKLETVRFEGLFETKKLVSYAQNFQTPKKAATGATSTATPAPISVKKATALLSQTHITPASVKAAVGGTPGTVKAVKKDENGFTQVAKLRAVDPSKPLSKQTPPPCNIYYITGTCSKGDACHYAHDYRLTPKQKATLKADAKKSPCINILKGRKCTDDCFAGHVCPFGAKCKYGKTCRFTAPGMHPSDPAGWSSTDGSESSDETSDSFSD